MLRLSKPIGFLFGVGLGLFTRDNYVYPYPLRVQDIEEDYIKLSNSVNSRIGEL